jgi:hypothetical protein
VQLLLPLGWWWVVTTIRCTLVLLLLLLGPWLTPGRCGTPLRLLLLL